MRLIEEANPDYESCADCIHSDDSEEICVLRRCIHAVSQLKECYVPKSPAIEPQRKKGHWIRHPEQKNIFNGKTIECSECHEKYTVRYVEDELFCRHCGADMREPEDIPMEYFESGGR